MLDDLRAAIGREDWGGGLTTALVWWRQTRAPEIANLIDVLGARCMLPPPPRVETHAWWMLHATTYNPVAVHALAARADLHAHRSECSFEETRELFAGNPVIERLLDPYADSTRTRFVRQLNRIQRLAAMMAWPDDPRTAQILARWFAAGRAHWDLREFEPMTAVFYTLLAERMIELGDIRVDEVLASSVVEPRGQSAEVRELQSHLARDVIAALVSRATALTDDDRTQLATWCAVLSVAIEVRDEKDEDALWAEVVRNPDDLGVRMVLADALIDDGDPRGQVIALQCNAADDARSYLDTRRLLDDHWDLWFGDAALVLAKLWCEFKNGMLDVAAIGRDTAPEWAYGKLAGNRELAAVRWLVPRHPITPAQYLRVLRDLPRFPPRVTVTHAIAEAMREHAPWSIREIELSRDAFTTTPRRIAASVELIATTIPELEWFAIHADRRTIPECCELVPRLPELFPRLARAQIETKDWKWEGTRADCAIPPAPP